MARYGREIGQMRTYLPDLEMLLVCLLAVGTVLRGIAASKSGKLSCVRYNFSKFGPLCFFNFI